MFFVDEEVRKAASGVCGVIEARDYLAPSIAIGAVITGPRRKRRKVDKVNLTQFGRR